MALQTTGAISLDDIHDEAGGTSETQASINDSDIRGLIGKSSGAQMSFNEWYGASSSVTMTSAAQINGQNNQREQSASSWVSAGETLIIPSNFWVWSDSTSVAALTIDVNNITVQNNGYIIGRGGDGGSGDNVDGGDGGPAIKINSGVTGVTITNGSGAYIAGGGGGGASGASGDAYAGGGGGAGGGSGGDGAGSDIKQSVSIGSAPSGGQINAYGDNVEDYDDGGAIGNTNHPNPPISGVVDAGAGGQGGHTNYDDVGLGGGSGGRKLGSDAVAGYGPSFTWYSSGGSTYTVAGGGSGGSNNNAGTAGGAGSGGGHAAGGGGGWGAAGGGNNENQDPPASGGAGGAAINDSGQTYSLTNNGTIWGSS